MRTNVQGVIVLERGSRDNSNGCFRFHCAFKLLHSIQTTNQKKLWRKLFERWEG